MLSFRPIPFLAIGFALVLAGCGGPREVRLTHPSGAPRAVGVTEDGRNTGPWTYWYASGAKQAEGAWLEDKQIGPWTWWFGDGRLRHQGSYLAGGLKDGPWRYWHPAGTVAAEGSYRFDRQDGTWRFAYASGRRCAEGGFDLGVKHGLWTRWPDAADGGPSESGIFFKGLKIGPWLVWKDGVPGLIRRGAPAGFTAAETTSAAGTTWTFTDASGAGGSVTLVAEAGQVRMRVELQSDGRTAAGEVLLPAAGLERLAPSNPSASETSSAAAGSATPAPATGTAPIGSPATAPPVTDAPVTQAPASATTAASTAAPTGTQPPAPQVAPPGMTLAMLAKKLPMIPPTAPVQAAAPEQMELSVEPAATGAPELSPTAVQPEILSERDRGNAQTLVQAYTRADPLGGDDYNFSAQGPSGGDPRGQKLVGTTIPQTRFLDSSGAVIDLRRLKKPVVLVVMRGFSGQVCIYCATQTAALSNQYRRFTEAGAEVVIIYPGPTESVPAFVAAVQQLRNEPPPMPVGLDAGLFLVRDLGIEDNLARPTSLVLDANGVIRYAYQGASISDRPTVEDLLTVVRRIPTP